MAMAILALNSVPARDLRYNHYDDKHERFDFCFYWVVVIDRTLEKARE